MTAHNCRELTDGCYRCELGKDEMDAIREELIAAIEREIHKASTDKLYVIEAVLDL